MTYRTIVADPPWDLEWNANIGVGRSGRPGLPYGTMSLEQISGLAVQDMAEPSAHLWLWTTHGFLWDAPRVALSWGFRPSYTLVWAKPGLGVGGRFRHTCEYILFCERGAQLPLTRRDLGTHFAWPKGEHSAKPDAFYDLVEDVSPGSLPRDVRAASKVRMGLPRRPIVGDGGVTFPSTPGPILVVDPIKRAAAHKRPAHGHRRYRSGANRHGTPASGFLPGRRGLDAPLSAENDPRRAEGVRPAQIRQEPPRTDTATHGGAGGSAGLRAPGTHRRTPSGNRHEHSFSTPEPSCRGMAYRPSKRPKDEAA